ncbi:cupin domain [Streptomyces sp. PanSC9]|nr:cupin domain [Streptomyces sp. PanSC9]
MEERHAIKPYSRRDPPWAAVSPATRRPDDPTIDPPGPAGRSHWHRHPLNQTVFVTEGIGLCQRRGGSIKVIRPGDRVLFEADEEHWHGAAPDRVMVRLAINEADADHDVVHWLTRTG